MEAYLAVKYHGDKENRGTGIRSQIK